MATGEGHGQASQIPPVYDKVKDLHLTTYLVHSGEANATIVTPSSGAYDDLAARIQDAIHARSGVRVPIARDDSPVAALPIGGNLILLGNRSTNKAISELYNRYYTLLDLWYPGEGGHVVRSLHNPFGDGHNVLFVGGSDASGVADATEVFVGAVTEAEVAEGELAVGWLMDIELGQGMVVPEDLREFETWEASAGYKSIGYFGWNSISKRMAMYYMTGDPHHAREAVRLAFPDEKAMEEITEIDGERIENKDEPLSGPYHYNTHMMILYWDLIEESPVFSDEERLRITNAFSKQFAHQQEQGWRRQIVENVESGVLDYSDPPSRVGSRHGQWSAIGLYCLGRYFQKDYPHPLWDHCVEAGKWHFSPLHHHAWVDGEHDNLFWYNTGMAPILSYMLLTGDRKLLENGVLQRVLRGQEILASGREPDWALNSASIGFLRKAAHLTGEGRYLEYLRRTGMDLGIFRLGQSYHPEDHLEPKLSPDLAGKWSIHPIPEPMWKERDSGLPLEDSFLFGSFRNALDASGDFILIKGMNGASRNPYHTFAVLQVRLDGHTVLDGYLNQVLTRVDGTVEPQVAMDAALRHSDVLGGTAVAVGEVPRAAFSNWRRSLVQRVGRYALIVDDLTFRSDGDSAEVEVSWQGGGDWSEAGEAGAVLARVDGSPFEIRFADPVPTTVGRGSARMAWQGAPGKGEQKVFFSLIAEASDGSTDGPACLRVADNAAALRLPKPALAVTGTHEGISGELVILATDHLHGLDLREAGLGGPLLEADSNVNVDWDFDTGTLAVATDADVVLKLAVEDASGLALNGEELKSTPSASGRTEVAVSSGRHEITGAKPSRAAAEVLATELGARLQQGLDARRTASLAGGPALPDVETLDPSCSGRVGGKVVDLVTFELDGQRRICAAEGETVHVLGPDGQVLRTLQTDGAIRTLRWWDEHGLLLAGCVDDQTIAFDPASGERRWVFMSQEDPAVFRAAKPYWFKTAPGHAGVHGVHTGTFLDGKSQAFLGGACTLEIVDENGQLVERMPVFWGPGSKFALIDGPEGSTNLLIARQPTDSHALAVINNRAPEPRTRSFRDVPAGFTNIGGWACMSRKHIFYEDVNGDGRKEVVSEVNGTWNRVTVWSEDGTPLHNVHLGPGQRIPAQNVRDLDLADLNGDGTRQILAALSSGLVLALDCRCERLWSVSLPSPPTVLACVGAGETARIVVGCEDGALVVMDGKGTIVQKGQVKGGPTRIEAIGGEVLIATDEGEITAWTIGD